MRNADQDEEPSLVADGIEIALIPTATGMVIAIPIEFQARQ
ncbi:MAG TPA: MotA/TolQ/ExbB proton channel family protein [Longimicrobiales bacterium]